MGPMSTLSSPWPIRSRRVLRLNAVMNSSYTSSWTRIFSADVQTCPQLRKAANVAALAATSIAAEGITMNESLPEASIRKGLKLLAQVRATTWPVGTLPVNATMCVSGCLPVDTDRARERRTRAMVEAGGMGARASWF